MRLLAFLILLGASSAASAQEEHSLFERYSAKPVPREVRGVFGPGAGELRYDARMLRAAMIAVERAHRETTWRCWAYVKDALLAAGVTSSRPTSTWARQAGGELTAYFGFKKLPEMNPWKAPVGAVIVYDGEDGGHVEIRTPEGFASDFTSPSPYPRKVLGIYVKPV